MRRNWLLWGRDMGRRGDEGYRGGDSNRCERADGNHEYSDGEVFSKTC